MEIANANVTFAPSSGGQIALVTKSGTDRFHGGGYLYHTDSALAANSWTNNRLGIARPFLLDNRFGGSLGGPINKDRTFFFVNYEGRRRPDSVTVTRIVPRDSLKEGNLLFYELLGGHQVTSTLNPAAIKALDLRGIGPNQKILE